MIPIPEEFYVVIGIAIVLGGLFLLAMRDMRRSQAERKAFEAKGINVGKIDVHVRFDNGNEYTKPCYGEYRGYFCGNPCIISAEFNADEFITDTDPIEFNPDIFIPRRRVKLYSKSSKQDHLVYGNGCN